MIKNIRPFLAFVNFLVRMSFLKWRKQWISPARPEHPWEKTGRPLRQPFRHRPRKKRVSQRDL